MSSSGVCAKCSGMLAALFVCVAIGGEPSGLPRGLSETPGGIGRAVPRDLGPNGTGDPAYLRIPTPPEPLVPAPVDLPPVSGFGPAADCNANGTQDTTDIAYNLLGAPPSQFLTDAGIDAQSDRRGNMRCDDFILTANTAISAIDVEGREGGAVGDRFIVRFWAAYSITDANTDGIADPGTFHPLFIEYTESVPASRVTRTLVSGSIFRWNIKLATPVVLAGLPTGGGITHFLEVVYTGPAANLWTWERNTTAVGSDIHATQHLPEVWINQPTLNGLRFRLYASTSGDVNTNTIPDECEDCNSNGSPDAGETGVPDCNTNRVKDTCELRFGLSSDCNTNGVPDGCEAGDCNSNGTNDVCDISAGAADCNSNRVPDACEINALSAPAFEQNSGYWPTSGFVSDISYSAGGTLVRADDFFLAGPRAIGGVSLFGFYLPIASGGNGVTDTYTVRIWSNSGTNQPNVVEYTEAVPASRITRTAFLPNFFSNVWRYNLQLKQPVALSSGRHWLEIFYTGPAAGDWLWSYLEISAGFPVHSSNLPVNEVWAPASNIARLYMTGYVAATDCDTNATLDLCELTGRDLNTDGLLDVCTDCNTNGTFDQTEAGFIDCNSNGRLDACDLLAGGGSLNCNTNAIPDECELPDCNTNHVPDACDRLTMDCDTNGTVDACGQDCNTNGSADACDVNAGGAAVDCNSNGTLDVCGEDCNTNGKADACDLALGAADCNSNQTLDACDVDCNSNQTPDDCDVLNPAADCNENGFVDVCETAGTLLTAVDQTGGLSTGFGYFSDVRSNQVLADDFVVSSEFKVTGVQVSGFYAAPGAGPVSADSFVVRLWNDAGGPNSVLHSQSVSGAALSRSGSYTHMLRLSTAVKLVPGTYWLEVYYTGTAPGMWTWFDRSPRVGAFSRQSTASFPESWSSSGLDSHWDFRVFRGASDADTNNIPDECIANPCLSCPGDLDANGRVDGQDVHFFVEILLTGHSGCVQAACADFDHDVDVDMNDAALFAARLMAPNLNCP